MRDNFTSENREAEYQKFLMDLEENRKQQIFSWTSKTHMTKLTE